MLSRFRLSLLQDLLRRRSVMVAVMGIGNALLLWSLLWQASAAATARPDAASPGGGPALVSKGGASGPAGNTGLTGGSLSPAFTAEVRHWEPQIIAWAAEYDLDPNLVATLMQIESCGNPAAVSVSGARGLFQVMPFHFSAGEEMLDPETNAGRGLDYLTQVLSLTEGHVGMALAGYNGGRAAAEGNWESWTPETRRYYRWAGGIFTDVSTGLTDSPTLHDWLAAGGASLCQQAADQLGMR